LLSPILPPHRRLWIILSECDFAPVEIVVILYGALWGIGLLSPPASFASAGSYRLLGMFANEDVWGVALVLLAVCHSYGILWQHLQLRKLGLAGQMMIWSAIATLTYLSNPASLGWWHFSLMACVSLWCWARLRKYE